MALDRATMAEECVRQGVFFGVEPHYLLAVAQLRSSISSDNDGDRKGPFRLTQAEWDANCTSEEFDLHFTPAQISSPLRQCAVFAFMTNRAFTDFVIASKKNPTSNELYSKQFPGAETSGLQQAFDDTAALVGPAADAVLDEPEAVAPLPEADQPTPGPPVITPDPIPRAAGAGGGMLTLDMLRRRWPVPPAKDEIIQGMANTAGVLGQLGINTPLRMAHFMAQVSEETDSGREMTESLNYRAERILEVFPTHFSDLQSAMPFAHNERALGNKVYNGRMHNRIGTDDGFNFRGRGCLQITGRDSYEKIGQSLGLDLVGNPDSVNDPQNVLLIAGTEFVKSGCLPDCDADNVVRVSARINVGDPSAGPGKIIGLDERKKQLRIWKQEFGVA
jgi:putative chitinase